jgi:hypothetical protein
MFQLRKVELDRFVLRLYWDSSAGLVTGYGVDTRGICSIFGRGKRFSLSPLRLYWLWGPLSLLPKRYRRRFPRG